jgi:peptidoglycan biosynthesis protein MviN/MurJ (putative lipid II flippase)
VVPTPIVQGLFERGAFTAADTPATAYALAIFALGLPSFVLIKVFSPAYFAREDTATPMRYATLSLTLNTVARLHYFSPSRFGLHAAPGDRGGNHAWGLAQCRPALCDARAQRTLCQ